MAMGKKRSIESNDDILKKLNGQQPSSEPDVLVSDDPDPILKKLNSGTLKKKDLTEKNQKSPASSTPVGLDGSQDLSKNPLQPFERNTAEEKLKKRSELLEKVARAEYEDWTTKRVSELQKFVDQNPDQYENIISQFNEERASKIKELDDTFGKFSELYSKDYSLESQKERTADFERNKIRNPIKSISKSAWAVARYDLPSALVSLSSTTQGKGGGPSAFGLNMTETLKDIEKKQPMGTELEKRELKQKLNLILQSQKIQAQGAEYKKNLVNSLDKISDPVDAINWAMSALGQAGAQIPVGLATGGGSMFVQEVGSIYLDGLEKLSEESGKSIEEIIKNEEDDSLTPLIFGTAAAGLDLIGARGVKDALGGKQLMSAMRTRAIAILKAGGKEAITEGIQTGLETIGVNRSADKTWAETFNEFTKSGTWKDIIEASAQGLVGGSGLTMTGQGIQKAAEVIKKPKLTPLEKIQTADELIRKKTENIDTNDIKAVDEAAGKIDAKITESENIITEEKAVVQEEPVVAPQEVEQIQEPEAVEPAYVAKEKFEVGITSATEKIPEISTLMQQGKELERAGNFSERDDVFNKILDIGESVIKERLSGVEGASIQLDRTVGNFFGYSEPTFKGNLEVDQKSTNKAIQAIAAAAEDMNQDAVHISQFKPMLEENEVFGEELEDGSVYEPDVNINFDQELTPFEIKKLEKITQKEAGLAGFTINPDKKGINLYNISKFTSDEEFKSKLGKVKEILDSKGVRYNVEGRVRRLYNIGSEESGATRSYEQIRGPVNTEKQVGSPTEVKTSPIKQTSLGSRIEAFEETPEIKERVKKADEYIRRKVSVTAQEAKDLLKEWGDTEHAERVIRDKSFDLKPGVRATLAANLYEQYKNEAAEAQDVNQKAILHDKAADIGIWAAQELTRHGQESAVAGLIWKSMLQNEDIAVIALEKQNQRGAKKLIAPIQAEVTESKQQFDEQIRKLIEQKVTEGVEARLEKAKLITKEKRKEISDFFDSLMVKPKKGELNDISRVVGAEIWNGSIKVVKRAILTGVDVANAIQAGIDYIKENYKGTDFNEDDFKKLLTPSVEKIAQLPVKPEQIDESKIKTPKLKGKKKKDFINAVVDAYNEGSLTDEKFEELYAKGLGYRPYTPAERKKIRELSKAIGAIEKFKETARDEWSKISDEFKASQENGTSTVQARKKFENLIDRNSKVIREAQKANMEMQKFARLPNDLSDTLIAIMQGNLLSPLSLVTNVYSNALLQPLRFSSTVVGGGIDITTSALAKTGLIGQTYKNRTINIPALFKGYFKGGWNGTFEGLYQLKTGTLAEERSLREIQSGFSPSRAIERWIDKDRSVKQKVNDYIEGTFGVPAEVMFRLLNLGDKPFKRAAEMARAYEIGTLKGLKGNDLIGFILFPDAESQQEIVKAGQEATFQQETKVSQGVQRGIQWFLDLIGDVPILGGFGKVLLKSQIPYVKTPLNITIETIDYAIPPLTLARGIYAYSIGQRRVGNILVGKAIVGSMIIAAARELFKLVVLEPDEDEREKFGKKKEARSLRYETVPPSSINISALMRGLIGDGFERKDDDINISFKKMGPLGILIDVHAKDMYSELKEDGKVESSINGLFVDMLTTAPKVASSALDQSFLAGTSALLTAIQDAGGYETEQWLINSTGAMTSIVWPNTLATLSKSSDEFIRDTYDKDFGKRLKNAYAAKIFLGDKVPAKVNLWGQKITGSPEGRNKYAYYLFDVTKFKETPTDDFRYRLYEKWKESGYDNDWLPSMPTRTMTVNGHKIPVRGKDYELLCTYVGKARYEMCQAVIKSNLPPDMTVKLLKGRYSEGAASGKRRFLLDKGWLVLTDSQLEKMAKGE